MVVMAWATWIIEPLKSRETQSNRAGPAQASPAAFGQRAGVMEWWLAANPSLWFYSRSGRILDQRALDRRADLRDYSRVVFGGVLVSTWGIRQRRHAEDGSLASLIIEPKHNC